MSERPKLVLASASPRRLALLQQAGIEPDLLRPADIDETPRRGETAKTLAKRLSREKAALAQNYLFNEPEVGPAFIVAADTVVAVGRRILPKPDTLEEATGCLRLLSGRSHRVISAVSMITPKGEHRQRLADTRVRFKRLGREEMESYLASGEWRGKAGGYAIQGLAGAFVVKLNGSYTGVVGLPLEVTVSLLRGEGYPVYLNWLSGGV
jgi:septum formation protein